MKKTKELRLPALEVRQSKQRLLYSFAMDGKLLPKVTTISRIVRDENHQILGYQRPEVLSHISEIRNYLESDNPMIPNAIVVAFDERVRFEPLSDTKGSEFSRPGLLVIPIDEGQPDELKPGWIVDGQQRSAAIRDARISHFPVCVVSFIAEGDTEQREQFILVNSTKPLPKGLVYELLPSTEARLPTMLQRRRFPNLLLDRLNLDEDSPLRGMIRTPTVSTGVIKDNSLIKMIENSLSDGVLFRFRSDDGKKGDTERILETLKNFWAAVAHVYRPA